MDGNKTATAPTVEAKGGSEGWEAAESAADDATAEAVWGDKIPEALYKANAKQLAAYADSFSIDFSNAGNISVDAFLLNCMEHAVDIKKAEFKFTAFDPANPPTADVFDTKKYNGVVVIEGKAALSDADWGTPDETTRFYRAVLMLKAPEVE